MDPAQTLAWPRLSAWVGEGSFSIQFDYVNKETQAEINIAQALFSGQRMEKQELSSQINFWPTWREGFDFIE